MEINNKSIHYYRWIYLLFFITLIPSVTNTKMNFLGK